jgi:undecaprenyl-diphosphatase
MGHAMTLLVSSFDSSILHFLNQFAQRSWMFDKTMVFISTDPFVSGGVAMTFFWWAWFRKSTTKTRDRELVICGLVASFVALFVARGLATILPFRARPYLNPELHFRAPLGTAQYYFDLIHWSSFPSDHAVLYFSLATCIYLVSRKVGILAYCHALFIVCLPLIYLGEHYPTDILAGALLGIAIGSLSEINSLHDRLSRWPMRVLQSSPAGFYTCFFLCSFLFATNFDSVRKMIFYATHALAGSGHVQY